ncbi:hypothetical protein MKEN_01328000 [Mycena kentingensis (nom. inval.)]|nr:hypothetical protein MKEN_01328000 [Mycena kentingensis (nom. inval.)]
MHTPVSGSCGRTPPGFPSNHYPRRSALAMPELAIVDDRDTSIAWAGSWTDGGVAQEFDSTTHWAATTGSTGTFKFNGTGVAVYGTVASGSTTGSLDFSIDGTKVGTYTAPGLTAYVHHESLFQSAKLDDTTHTLVMTATGVGTRGIVFIDFITYNTSARANVPAYFIDDRDARVKYQPSWQAVANETSFMHTCSNNPASGAVVSLQFEGRGISLYGGLETGKQASVSISVDDGTPVPFVRSLAPNLELTNNLIFKSADLKNGTHTIKVTTNNDNPFSVDYFLVVPPLPVAGDSSQGQSSTPAPSGTSPTGSDAATLPASGSGGHKNQIIIGVAAVLAALILLAALAFVFLRRRRRQNASAFAAADTARREETIEPFLPPATIRSSLHTPYSDTSSSIGQLSSPTSSSPLSLSSAFPTQPWMMASTSSGIGSTGSSTADSSRSPMMQKYNRSTSTFGTGTGTGTAMSSAFGTSTSAVALSPKQQMLLQQQQQQPGASSPLRDTVVAGSSSSHQQHGAPAPVPVPIPPQQQREEEHVDDVPPPAYLERE